MTKRRIVIEPREAKASPATRPNQRVVVVSELSEEERAELVRLLELELGRL